MLKAASNNPNAQSQPPVSTDFFRYAAPLGQSTTSATNTNAMVTNSIYGVLFPAVAGTYDTISVRTSDSNASSGASVRFGIYEVDPLTLLPGALVATTGTVAITDAALSTVFSGTFTSNVTLASKTYLAVIHATATTTGARFCVPTTGIPWFNYYGNNVLATAHTGGAIMGYYKSGATFASGLPATFGTPTNNITSPTSSTTNMCPFLILGLL